MRERYVLTRRGLIARSALLGGGLLAVPSTRGRAQAPAASGRVTAPQGTQVGDITGDRAILWSRADREAKMLVELSTSESFARSWTVQGPAALEDTDFTARLDLQGLPPGQRVFYRVRFLDLGDLRSESEPVTGSFATPPGGRGAVRFVWSADTVGQGWGINPDFGGMRIYETMRQVEPQFFIHSGDTIYADGPVYAEARNQDGSTWLGPDGKPWRNLVIEEKQKVAESLREFRAAYAYNLMDENLRRFNAQVPMFPQWDDHEVLNNWYWEKLLSGDKRYTEKRVSVLASRASRAFHDYMPIRQDPFERDRVYNSCRWGPSLEVFRLDMRSYRAANGDNLQPQQGPETRFLGREQIRWLKQALLASDATWKVIAADMPIGVLVFDNFVERRGSEAVAQGNGPALGRELEIAELFTFIHRNGIRNTVWLTADLHYTAAHRYDPNRARYQDFAPFWEFVSGPLNAGTFGPNELDDTFGPEAVFVKAPEAGQVNLPPSAGMQFFGQVDIDGTSEVMTVRLKDIAGATLFTQELVPEI
jgi:alkaline phosphatase D